MSVNVLFMDMHDHDTNPLFHLPADRCHPSLPFATCPVEGGWGLQDQKATDRQGLGRESYLGSN